MNAIAEKLARRIEAVNSLLCVGLDPDFEKLPQRYRGHADAQRRFGEWIVDETAQYAAAIKLNAAFYEARGAEGVAEMERTVEYVRARYPELVTICDAKRADIGNTNKGYVEAIFDRMGFDAVTLHPYLGREALEPFLSRRDKMCIVLCRTSNAGAGEFQDLNVDGKPLWLKVAERVSSTWDVEGNCALVVGATYSEEMRLVREVAPRTMMLVPGVGAQGGDVDAAVRAGLDARGAGMLLSASRSILFSDNPGAAAGTLRDEINSRGRWCMLRVEGRIANEDAEFDGAIEIDTKTGLIASVGAREGRSDLDTDGCLIFPGFGDLHVHAREDVSGREMYKEDFASASAAAIHGGVTHFADMPNNPVAPIDDASYAAKEKLTAGTAVHITLYGGIGPGTRPLARAVPYKAFMGPSVGELFFSSPEQLEETIARYRGCSVSFHCEDPLILRLSRGAATHEQRRPASAEISATRFALQLIERYELQGKLCHFSTGEGLKDVIAAKARGVKVTCEVTPHHLFFDDTMLNDENRLWLQMNPPLRGREDRLAIIEALRTGEIDYLATDHAPHSLEEKGKGTSGVPHLDTYGAFTTWLMVEHGFTAQQIGRVCAANPGRFVRPYLPKSYGKGFGRVEEGYVGSLTVLDLKTPYAVKRETLKTKCGWSPFEGVRFPGSVRHTVVRGRVYSQGDGR